MQGVFTPRGIMIGDIEKSEAGGWFASLLDNEDDCNIIEETFHRTKRQAISHLRKQYKINNKVQSL